jgi:hypothetical protein
MLENRVKRRYGACRDAFPTGGRPATAPRARFRRFAGGDVRLGALDVAERQCADVTPAEQGLDMCLDAAAVHRECRSLDGPPAPSEDPTGFRLR